MSSDLKKEIAMRDELLAGKGTTPPKQTDSRAERND